MIDSVWIVVSVVWTIDWVSSGSNSVLTVVSVGGKVGWFVVYILGGSIVSGRSERSAVCRCGGGSRDGDGCCSV